MIAEKPLANDKVAVLVESQYIPQELRDYQQRFTELGATVHFISRLWGQPKQTFVSEVEEPGHTPEVFEVSIDVESIRPEDYAAVIMAANYTSVRLRYFSPPHTPRTTPAVKFFSEAMKNPSIVKGVLCHGLWLLTAAPELLAGRKVICHEVVYSDIVNAGAIYTTSPTNVVVDGDLVTGRSYHEALAMVDAICETIVCRRQEHADQAAPTVSGIPPMNIPTTTTQKRILIVLSERGYWGEELIGPLDMLDAAGYDVDFVTPTGQRPVALPPSKDENFIDPPLNRPITTPQVAAKVREIDDPTTPQGKRLSNPINLSEWFPERPYYAAASFVRGMEAYNRALDRVQKDVEKYDLLLIVGGSGPIVDLANNQRVHDLILSFYQMGKPIAAECYGVTCLAFARNVEDRRSIIRNKHVTGHCLEYDYKDGTGFLGTDFNMGPPPYPLEFILRDATAPDGQYIGNFGKETSVIVDYPFITGRSTPDSYLTGQKLVEVLENGLKRYGW